VVESLINLCKLDVSKRNILDIPNNRLCLSLHLAAAKCPKPEIIKLLVRHNPPALVAEDKGGVNPLDYAIGSNKSPNVVILMRKLTMAYQHGHFSALIRLCGTSDSLKTLALRSTDDVPLIVFCNCDSWEVALKRINAHF